jgi:hypothetical protein
MMDAVRASETSVKFYQTTLRNTTEGSYRHPRRRLEPEISQKVNENVHYFKAALSQYLP